MKNKSRVLLCGLLFCLMMVFSLSGTAEINRGVWYHQQPKSSNDSGPFYGGSSSYEGFCGLASVSMGLHYFVPNVLAQLHNVYGEVSYHNDGRGGLKDHDPYCYSRYRTYTFQDFLGHKYIGRHVDASAGCAYWEIRNIILGVANDLPNYTAQTAYITRGQMRDYLDNGWLMVMNVWPGHYVLVTGWNGSLTDPSQRYIYIYDPWDYPLGLSSSQYSYQRELAGNRPNYGAAPNLTAIRVTANTMNSSSYFKDQRGDGTMLAFKLTPTNYPAAAAEVGAKGVWLLGSTARTYGVTNVVDTCAQRGITDIFLMAKGTDGSYRVDTLNQVIQAAQPHGIKVHAWLTVLNDHAAASSGSYNTVGGDWIDARDVSYREYILDDIITPLLQCDIDGIHLDYMRYPGNANNYSGAQAAVTTYCQEIRGLMNTVDPTLTLSSAVTAEGAGTAPYYGQNVANMSPYLQFIVPMTYTHAYKAAPSWVGGQISYFKNQAYPGCEVWAGIETMDSYGNYMTPLEMKQCVDYAVANDADGIVYFRYPLYYWQWNQSDSWNIASPVYFEDGRVISAATDSNRYFAEDEVTVSITVKNTGNLDLVNPVVEWTIKDPNDNVKDTGSDTISLLTPNSTETVGDSYQLPAEAPTGYWTVEYLFKTSSETVLDSSSMHGNIPVEFTVEGENTDGRIVSQSTNSTHYYPANTVTANAVVQNDGDCTLTNAKVKFDYVDPDDTVVDSSTQVISELAIGETANVNDQFTLGSTPLEVSGDWKVLITFTDSYDEVFDARSDLTFNVYETVSLTQLISMAANTANYMDNNYSGGYHTYPDSVSVGDGRTVSLAQMTDMTARVIRYYEQQGEFTNYVRIRPVEGQPLAGDPNSWMWKDEGESGDGSNYDNIAYLWNAQNYGSEYLYYVNKLEFLDACIRLADFVDNNDRMPNYNTVWNDYYSPNQWNSVPTCQFLYMMVRALRFMDNEDRWPNIIGVVHMTVPQSKAAWEQLEQSSYSGVIVTQFTDSSHYFPADTVTTTATVKNTGFVSLENLEVEFVYKNPDDVVVETSSHNVSYLGVDQSVNINDQYVLGSVPLEVDGDWTVCITFSTSSEEVLDTRSDLGFNVYRTVSKAQYIYMSANTANYMDNNYSGGYHTYPNYINVEDGRTVSLAQMSDIAARAIRHFESYETLPEYITIRPVEGQPLAGDGGSWMWKDEGESDDGLDYDNIAYLWNAQNYGPEYLYWINKAELLDACTRLANFIDNNERLPNYNSVWNDYYSPNQWNSVPPCQFLYMMVRALRFWGNEDRMPNIIGIVHMTVPQSKAAWEQEADEPSKEILKVAVFEHSGATSSNCVAQSVGILNANGIQAQTISNTSIQQGGLDDFAVLILPGGSGGATAEAIGQSGAAEIYDFVAAGGGVIGVCAGGYYMVNGYSTATSWLELIDVDILDIENWDRGTGTVQVEVEASSHPILNGYQGVFNAYYANGPLLDVAEGELPYEILCSYESAVQQGEEIMIDTPALVTAGYGRGRCVWSSFHPELTSGLETLLVHAVEWAANQ